MYLLLLFAENHNRQRKVSFGLTSADAIMRGADHALVPLSAKPLMNQLSYCLMGKAVSLGVVVVYDK